MQLRGFERISPGWSGAGWRGKALAALAFTGYKLADFAKALGCARFLGVREVELVPGEA